MKVYIAAPYPERLAAQALLRWIESAGDEVTSTWLREEDTLDDFHAQLDLDDVARADVLLAFNPKAYAEAGTGGRHVELGYALALGKPVVLLGSRTNIFHHLDRIVAVDGVDAMLAALAEMRTCISLSAEPAYRGTLEAP